MLSICTFMWGSKYSHEHVLKLGRMLRRNLTIPFQYVLISDQALHDRHLLEGEDGAPDRYVPLWQSMRDAKLCGVRILAFAESMKQVVGDRFAWVDLDIVITGNVDHIFGRTEPFIALATPAPPLAYNGSLVMMDAGARAHVAHTWTPEAYAALPAHYAKLGMGAGGQSDEGWMTWVLGPNEPTFNGGWGKREDGIYYYRKDLNQGRAELPSDARMVIMNGHAYDPASKRCQRRSPWILEHWR